MENKTIMIIYLILLVAILLLISITKKRNYRYYESLSKKEHPLKFMYPAAALIYEKLKRFPFIRVDNRLIKKMKGLYIKENVAEEVFLYTLKKISMILTIFLIAGMLGTLFCFSVIRAGYVHDLERNPHGKGDAYYDLDVMYGNEEETIQIVLAEKKMSEEEIINYFDKSIEDIKRQMLNTNKDSEHVFNNVDLITSYEDISVFWEIEDTDILDYNGGISEEIKDDEETLLNLYATLSMDDVSKTYSVPIIIRKKTLSEREMIIKDIMESIDENNSEYDQRVVLPEEINDKKLFFSKSGSENTYIFLVLSIIATFLIFFGYDKNLDKQIQKRNEQMLLDFTEIVSKLSLLYEAGLSIYKAWEVIVENHEANECGNERFAYKEMKMTIEMIKSGTSERQAYAEFGKRCGLHPFIKLGNILEQNLTKGTKGMKQLLKQEVEEAFEERKRIARKRGEEASTKLLLPMVLMLVVVIVIIAVPALMTMQI